MLVTVQVNSKTTISNSSNTEGNTQYVILFHPILWI